MVEFACLRTPLSRVFCDTFAVNSFHLHGLSSSPALSVRWMGKGAPAHGT